MNKLERIKNEKNLLEKLLLNKKGNIVEKEAYTALQSYLTKIDAMVANLVEGVEV